MLPLKGQIDEECDATGVAKSRAGGFKSILKQIASFLKKIVLSYMYYS